MNSVRLALVTWNVGGGPTGVTPGTDKLLSCARTADVIVVGLQEVAVARRGWKSSLGKALGPTWAYIGGESYAGLRLRVFAHVRLGKPVATVTTAGMKVGAGFADRWPNKGAIAVEIRFAPSCRVLFIVAHLAANEHHVVERQDDWRAILRRLDRDAFLSRGTDPAIQVPLFHRYEHVFVLGDLNYRIEAPGTDLARRVQWVQDRVDRRDWKSLLLADQLTHERHSGKVFANFQEASIAFPPTFKIDPRTGRYSPSRVPSFCDRVLWHSLPARVPLVTNVRYEPLSEFRQSDHVPIVAEFQLDVPIISSPIRAPHFTGGLRVVLEFQLIRYIKGRGGGMLRLAALSDTPQSIRRIDNAKPFASGSHNILLSGNKAAPGGNAPIVEHSDDEAICRHRTRLDSIDISNIHDNNMFIDADDEDDGEEEDNEDDDDESFSSTSSESSDDEYSRSPCALPSQVASRLRTMPPRGATTVCLDRSVAKAKASGDSSREFDEDLLEDMFTRQVSTSSSTDTSIVGFGSGSPSGTRGTPTPHGQTTPTAFFSESSNSGTSADTEGSLRERASTEPVLAMHSSGITGLTDQAHLGSGPRKRDSLSKQVHQRRGTSKAKRRGRLNGMRMEVHGYGLFLKQGRVYSVSIPKRRNGQRERIGESLPVIPLLPLARLDDLQFRHVLIEFAKKKSSVGTSGALPLKELLPYAGAPYAFEMTLTKYGEPVGTLEACVQLTIRQDGCWMDSHGRVVRNFDGASNKCYHGSLPLRKKTRARTKRDHGKLR